jgi:hypothetical protein
MHSFEHTMPSGSMDNLMFLSGIFPYFSHFVDMYGTYVLTILFLLFFRVVTVDEKLEVYLKIAALYLEAGDAVQAEIFVNRASAFIHDTSTAILIMMHKVCIRVNT